MDFEELARAVDKAGFKAGEIQIRATGTLTIAGGHLALKVAGSDQVIPLVEDEQAARLRGEAGRRGTLTGRARGKALAVETFVPKP